MSVTNTGPAQVTLTPSSLPSGFCPATEQERLNEYAKRLVGSLPGAYSTFLCQSTVPSATDRDKPWLRLNADGTIDRWYTFANGVWRSPHILLPRTVMIWLGDQTEIATLDGGTSASTDTETTGQFWREVTNLQGRFPLGCGTLPSTTVVSKGTTGGTEKTTLNKDQLPDHMHNMAIQTKACQYGSGSLADIFYVASLTGGTFPSLGMTNASAAGQTHDNMPPYFGVFFIRRTSRIYYVQ